MTASTDNASRSRLSVAMIVRDEQEVLAESIESVRPIADEIVILDTGSTDRTVAVAERLGATVDRMQWSDDFSAARNRCLKQATGDWILWLDAGERLERDSAVELRNFVDGQADPAKAYLLLVQVPPPVSGSTGPSASGEQIAQLRLIPNHPDLRFEGRLRETLQPSLEAVGLEIDAAGSRIVRHRRQHDPARKARLARRDLKLAELETAENDASPPPRLRLAVGDAHSNLGDQAPARQAFLAAIEAAEHGSTEMLEAYYGLLATYDSDKLLGELQLTACLEALEIFPLDAQLLLATGNYLLARNRVDLALRSFETAVKHGQVNLETWHLTELAEVAAGCLNLTLQMQEEDDQARGVLEDALKRSPSSKRLLRHLVDLHVKHGRSEEAVALADRLPLAADGREPLRNAIRGACKAANEDWTPALGYLQSAYVAGCRDPLCLRWLSVTFLSNGQVEAARPVLREWQEVEPANVEPQRYLAALEHQGELARPGQEAPAEQPVGGPPDRQFRVDSGSTVLDAAPAILPIISQISSADAMAQDDVY